MNDWLVDRNKQMVLAIGVVILAFAVYTLMQEPEDFRSPREISEANLELLVEAARQRDIGPFEAMLSDTVIDDSNRNKADLIKILRLIFFRHQKVYLNILEMKSEETVPDQEVVIQLTMLMGEQAITVEKGTFEVAFQREGNNFLVSRVKWGSGYGY